MSQQFGPTPEVVSSIHQVSPAALEEIVQWIEQRGIRSPASTIAGLRPAVGVLAGNGTPEAVVTAPVGTLFRRLDGGASTTLYIKETGAGSTGWRAV